MSIHTNKWVLLFILLYVLNTVVFNIAECSKTLIKISLSSLVIIVIAYKFEAWLNTNKESCQGTHQIGLPLLCGQSSPYFCYLLHSVPPGWKHKTHSLLTTVISICYITLKATVSQPYQETLSWDVAGWCWHRGRAKWSRGDPAAHQTPTSGGSSASVSGHSRSPPTSCWSLGDFGWNKPQHIASLSYLFNYDTAMGGSQNKNM